MNPFIPCLVLAEIGVFLTFVKVLLNSNRNQFILPYLCALVMVWVSVLFNLAISLFYAGFSI